MRSPSAGDDRGSAAAEFAVALPAVVLVLALGFGAVGAVSQQVRLQDAAADAARVLGRGDTVGVATSRVQRAVAGAVLTRSSDGELVCVRAAAPVAGPLGHLGIMLGASSCALDGGR